MTRRLSLFLLPLASLVACSEPPQLTGRVTDVWGAPVPGAEVKIEGLADAVKTGGNGGFVIENVPTGSRNLVAMKDGYIKNIVKVDVPEEKDAEMPKAQLELYVQPENPGFYLVGPKRLDPGAYHHLEGVSIESVGTELGGLTGLPREGQARASGGIKTRFVFSSTLRASQLSQIDLQLHKMKFVPKQEVTGVLGDSDVKVNLWVADELVEFDLEGLPSESDYLITTREALKPGIYAFHTEGALTAKDTDALDKMPDELRVAFPFEVK